MDEGLIEENIAKGLKPPKLVKKVISTLSDSEIINIIHTLDLNNHSEARNLTIFMLLLDTGLRIGGLVSLKMADVHMSEGFLKVMGKGKKERIVPIGNNARRHYSVISSDTSLNLLIWESKMFFCQSMAIP